jgi:crossover junction endodeoxyribonuclease RuvC
MSAVKYGVILTPKDATASARLVMLYDELHQIIREYHPEIAAVEKLFFSRNVTTALAVGQARGVVMLCLEQSGIEAFEYTPNEVKQAVAGYGSAQKKQVQEMVRALLALDSIPKPDDAADALATMAGMTDRDSEVLAALTALGYSVVEAQAAIQALPKDAPEDTEERLRMALQYFQ